MNATHVHASHSHPHTNGPQIQKDSQFLERVQFPLNHRLATGTEGWSTIPIPIPRDNRLCSYNVVENEDFVLNFLPYNSIRDKFPSI